MNSVSRHAAPVFIDESGARTLQRRLLGPGLDDRKQREEFIESLVHNHPDIVPMADIEPTFTPLVSICRQLPTEAGDVDNLWLTPNGGIVLGECKLVRNPQARREVVAQALDYARALAGWHYGDLEAAAGKRLTSGSMTLWSLVSDQSELDEAQFVDAIETRLRSGRILLLIIGDGIQEGVESLTTSLQLHAGLHAVLALVELSIWTGVPGGTLVVPRIPLRTVLIERGIVVIEAGGGIRIDPPRAAGAVQPKPMSLSESDFYEQLNSNRPGTAENLRLFIDSLAELGIAPEFGKALTLRWAVSSDRRASAGYIDRSGRVWLTFAYRSAEQLGVTSAGDEYLDDVAAAVGGAVKRYEKCSPEVLGHDGKAVDIQTLLKVAERSKRAIARLVEKTRTIDE
ncbi:MAG: hypothetical protein ACXWVA_01940 [Rhodoplanes sp.]